jgi:hypothetical protein
MPCHLHLLRYEPALLDVAQAPERVAMFRDRETGDVCFATLWYGVNILHPHVALWIHDALGTRRDVCVSDDASVVCVDSGCSVCCISQDGEIGAIHVYDSVSGVIRGVPGRTLRLTAGGTAAHVLVREDSVLVVLDGVNGVHEYTVSSESGSKFVRAHDHSPVFCEPLTETGCYIHSATWSDGRYVLGSGGSVAIFGVRGEAPCVLDVPAGHTVESVAVFSENVAVLTCRRGVYRLACFDGIGQLVAEMFLPAFVVAARIFAAPSDIKLVPKSFMLYAECGCSGDCAVCPAGVWAQRPRCDLWVVALLGAD